MIEQFLGCWSTTGSIFGWSGASRNTTIFGKDEDCQLLDCPRCDQILQYKSKLLRKCIKCKKIYTVQQLKKSRAAPGLTDSQKRQLDDRFER